MKKENKADKVIRAEEADGRKRGELSEARRRTRHRIYQYIYDSEEGASKPELAEALQLSLPTVYRNLRELCEAGLVREGRTQRSSGGRPPQSYIVEKDAGFAVGIAASAGHLRMIASDLLMNELGYFSCGLSLKEDLGERIRTELEHFLEKHALDRKRLLGVGITLPGVLDEGKEMVILSPTMRMRNLQLKSIREKLPYPVFFENDSVCAGMAEWLSAPSGSREKSFVYLFLENGVGGAVFWEGRPYYGDRNRSAEFGHMTVLPGGRPCSCGKWGCLEAYLSTGRFSSELGITLEEFFAELKGGNREYRGLWEEARDCLLTAVHNLRLLYDCDIVLGGALSEFVEKELPALKRELRERDPFGEPADYLRIGRYPRRAEMRGAAWRIIQNFLDEV